MEVDRKGYQSRKAHQSGNPDVIRRISCDSLHTPRQERDPCLNNINLNLNSSSPGFTKEKIRHSQRPQRRYGLDCTYTKKSRNKLLQGSLENVSSNPFGEFDTQQSTLRRSRSLAISRESLFANLDLPISTTSNSSSRRHQLIPRAKLIDRNSLKDRRSIKERNGQEIYHSNDRSIIRNKSNFSSEYGGSQINHLNIQRSYRSSSSSTTRRTSIENPQYHQLSAFSNISSPQVDNLTSCYYKSVLQDRIRDTGESQLHVDCGLSLPNYYPDSRCETDISLTDISLIDNISITGENPNQDNQSTNNLFYRETPSPPECVSNIFYHDNISFGKNLLDSLESPKTKPRTIRQYTPQTHENDHFYGGKPRSLPNFSILFDDLNIDERKEHIYDTVEKIVGVKKYEELEAKLSLNYSQSDYNCDGVNTQEDEIEKGTREFNELETYLQENSIYDEIVDIQKDSLIDIETDKEIKDIINREQKEILKTTVQVPAANGIYSVVKKNADDFKTVVQVETSGERSPKDNKRHSHNYLKEFLESQKGSKKPLQNFISKKISRAFGEGKKSPTESNLENNQYHSLPDLSVGNNLRQCEKIDRKLRKCEKTEKLATPSNNRFIVNIGRHFDVTAESNIPVDFEVKISKIPKLKKAKNKNNSKNTENKHQLFINAVKNLNETLNGLSLDQQNKVVEVTTKSEPKFKNSTIKRLSQPKHRKNKDEKLDKNKIKPLPKISEETKESEQPKMNREFQKKIGTMRSYWGKLTSPVEEEQEERCKIIDVHTKVEDVIKKFEPKEAKEEKIESIVNTVKQVFEPKVVQQKGEKLSPFVKESCGRFERANNSQFESLNPNIVEIIEKEERTNNTDDEKCQKTLNSPLGKHKTVVKSKSASIEPEFDHVRYRVMKSEMFQKNIFANCQKESQFNGLMQYLQDYSFQELLIDNNIVIIEPIRSNIPHETSPSAKTQNITNLIRKQYLNGQNEEPRRKFFYHPIRVNKEMNEDELPNPDTVKQVRLMFEGGQKKSKSTQELDTITKKTIHYQTFDPDKDICSASDSNSNPSNCSEVGSNDNSNGDELCCEQQYVSEDVMKKIRECGTSVTYYGGRVLNKRNFKPNPMTKTIMDEIKVGNGWNCKGENKESYHGIKFKLLKSNSCSSRLELVGTKNLSAYKQKFFEKQKMLIDQKNRENRLKDRLLNENEESDEKGDEKGENEAPKIIATRGKKMTQWGGVNEEKTFNNINFSKTNNNNNNSHKTNYDYHNYKQVKARTKKIDDMEFEPYEVA